MAQSLHVAEGRGICRICWLLLERRGSGGGTDPVGTDPESLLVLGCRGPVRSWLTGRRGMCRLMLSNTSSRSPECAQCVTSPCDELACHKVWPFVEDIVSSWDGNMFLEVSHGHGKLQFLRPPQQKACNRPTRNIPVINSLQMQPDD